jgi:hypothetical protein
MATTKPQPKAKPAPAAASQQKTKVTAVSNVSFMFDKENYTIMAVGVVIVIIGFLLMTGAANDNPAVFNKEEIYSFRRISLAPVVVIIGFLIGIYAILKRPKTA